MEVPNPQFTRGDEVELTAWPRKGRVGFVESRSWTKFRDRPAYWRYTIRWPDGGMSSRSAEHLRAAEAIEGGASWQGTEPDEGTRRALILKAIYGELEDYFGPEGALVSREFFAIKLADAVESALLDSTIAEEAEDTQTGDAEPFAHSRPEVERLVEQREEARAGESTFKEQRDAALHLLRWLIGDLIPPLVPMRGDDPDDDETEDTEPADG